VNNRLSKRNNTSRYLGSKGGVKLRRKTSYS